MTKHEKKNKTTITDVIETVPLADLYLSDLNPRKEVAEEEIALLAESIVACGLIQNLAGLRDGDGKVGIVAGGRRLRALNIAVSERPELNTVPVRMAPSPLVAEEWANAENAAREALDPVDEVRAYGRMAANDLSIARISQAFGVTEAHVRRRLALAGLPEPVLEALKAGDISLGIAKAMTVSDDEKKILDVLDRAASGWMNEYQVKTMLMPQAVSGDSREAVFVGQEAYLAEGGTTTDDLFEDETLFNNPDILERLFTEKLEQAASDFRDAEGWAWVMTTEDAHPYMYELQQEHGFARVYKEEGVLDEAQAERYDALAELANGEVLDDEGQIELAALDAIIEGEYSDAQRAVAGAMVFVSHDGTVDAVRGLIRREDQEKAVAAGLLEASKHDTSPAKPKPAYSQKFVDDMRAIRLAAVQTALLDKPEFVLDLLAFSLSPASGYGSRIMGLRLDCERNVPEVDDAFVLHSRIGGARSEAEEADRDKLRATAREGVGKAFNAYRKAGKKHRNAEITESFAQAFTTQESDFMAVVEAEAGADIRRIWTPTAENCFKRLKADQLTTVYKTMLDLSDDSAALNSFAKSKKAEKVAALHNLFNDPEHQRACGVTGEQKARIDAWVPECF